MHADSVGEAKETLHVETSQSLLHASLCMAYFDLYLLPVIKVTINIITSSSMNSSGKLLNLREVLGIP